MDNGYKWCSNDVLKILKEQNIKFNDKRFDSDFY